MKISNLESISYFQIKIKTFTALTKEKVFNMAKTTGLFRIIAGVGGCACSSSIISKRKQR